MSKKIFEIAAYVAVGGAIAGTVVYAAKTVAASSGSGEEATDNNEALLLKGRDGLSQDRTLLDAVIEPEQLFRLVDSNETNKLLDALDGLALLFREAQLSGSPLLFAKALRHKRSGTAALDILLQVARRRFPGRAADAADDAEVLRKAMTDYVHNIQQSVSLARLEKVTENV